jgi:hypothetical protein
MAAVIRIADLAEMITARLSVCHSALAGDMRRFRTQFGEDPVREALQLIEHDAQVTADHWDERGHARAVKTGLMKAVDDHRQAEAEDVLSNALPGSWR